MAGLMKSSDNTDSILSSLRAAFGPQGNRQAQTLEQQLEALSETQMNNVMRTARFVKMSHSFGSNKYKPYKVLVDEMYPNMSLSLRKLIADILQDADPVTATVDPTADARDAAISTAVEEYEAILKDRMNITDQDVLEFEVEAGISDTPMQSPTPQQYDFLSKLAKSESSGRSDAEIRIKDGRTFTGLYQFGDARLTDYRNATGESFTTQQFKDDEQLQHKVAQWHFNDIDKAIDSMGDKATGYDRDGLRAVAHLAGIGGMKEYVRTQGTYNPSDELGTSAQDYYTKFSSGGGS